MTEELFNEKMPIEKIREEIIKRFGTDHQGYLHTPAGEGFSWQEALHTQLTL